MNGDTLLRWSLFPVVLAWALLAGCKHSPTAKEQAEAQIHYDLAVNAQEAGDKQNAYKELLIALEGDPDFAEAHFAMGLLLQSGFNRLDEAVKHYEHALKVRPNYSEAKVNLGTVYVAKGRYDEAIKLFESALNDMAYVTPYIAQGNLGWAHFKNGNVAKAIDPIKSAVTANPKFCLGYMWLGTIYEHQGDAEASCRQYGNYRENCPEQPDAYYREGLCLAKAGNAELAAERFATCEEKSEGDLRDDCRKLKATLQAPHQ